MTVTERIFVESDLSAVAGIAHCCLPCGLADNFAGHLRERRQSTTTPTVSGHPTRLAAADAILIPHFAAIARESEITDVVLWEAMPLQTFRRWCPDGVTLAHVAWLVAHVDDVVATRVLIRSGEVPSALQLRAALESGRYLSARLCLELRDALSTEWAS